MSVRSISAKLCVGLVFVALSMPAFAAPTATMVLSDAEITQIMGNKQLGKAVASELTKLGITDAAKSLQSAETLKAAIEVAVSRHPEMANSFRDNVEARINAVSAANLSSVDLNSVDAIRAGHTGPTMTTKAKAEAVMAKIEAFASTGKLDAEAAQAAIAAIKARPAMVNALGDGFFTKCGEFQNPAAVHNAVEILVAMEPAKSTGEMCNLAAGKMAELTGKEVATAVRDLQYLANPAACNIYTPKLCAGM